MIPLTSPAVKPVISLPAAGLRPTFPTIADVGTLEIKEAARTANPPASPRATGACGG
jgi:hypothetical protein